MGRQPSLRRHSRHPRAGRRRAVLNQSSARPAAAVPTQPGQTAYVLVRPCIQRLPTSAEDPGSIPGVQADSSVALRLTYANAAGAEPTRPVSHPPGPGSTTPDGYGPTVRYRVQLAAYADTGDSATLPALG
jgi:hypothetical protein